MELIGHVESLWRYPVKSMRGEELAEAYVTMGGFAGDRRFAFRSSVAPYLTSRAQERMLLYRPFYRNPLSVDGPHTSEENILLDVETPSGEIFAVDDPHLRQLLGEGLLQRQTLSLQRSGVALADEYPLSLFSVQTAQQLTGELGAPIDKRRFRANIYADFASGKGFDEDGLVGQKLRIGNEVVVDVVQRDPRCKVITLDPNTAKASPEILQHVIAAHERRAGVYATVVVEGIVRRGDAIALAS